MAFPLVATVPDVGRVTEVLPVSVKFKDEPAVFVASNPIFTKSEPFQAAKQRSPEVIVMPVVGPAPRSTMDPVPALITM